MSCILFSLFKDYPFIWQATALMTAVMVACLLRYLHVVILFRERPGTSDYALIFSMYNAHRQWIGPTAYMAAALYLFVLIASVVLQYTHGCPTNALPSPGLGFALLWSMILAAYLVLLWMELKTHWRMKRDAGRIYDQLIQTIAQRS